MRISDHAACVAVASRDREKSQQFVDSCSLNVPMVAGDQVVTVDAMGGYENLLARNDIDVVYIPLPTTLRKKWVIAAANAGKHILCEKPAAVHSDDLREMLAACDENNVQFMDGVMFDHSRRTPLMANVATSGQLGPLRRIEAHFSFPADDEFSKDNIRSRSDLEPHGALGDLGWYGIRFALWMQEFSLPKMVCGETLWSIGDGVPAEFSGQMKFEDGSIADVFCSFRCTNRQTATVSGADGYLSVDDFVLPFNGSKSGFEVHRHTLDIDRCRWIYNPETEPSGVAEYSAGESGSQEVRMIDQMSEIAVSGSTQSQYPKRTLLTQTVIDAMRRSDAAGGGWVETET